MPQRLPRALHERPRDRRLRRRALPPGGLLADRLLTATVLTGRDAGQYPLQRHAAELVTIGEMLIAPQWHLRLAIGRAHPRTLDPHPPTTKRHLPVLVTVTNRRAGRIVLALRTDDLIDLLLEQLPKHAESHLHRERQQPLPRSPNQLPQRLLHPLREHSLISDRLSDRYVALHGGSSFDLDRIARHAPTRSGRAGGTAVTSKFYEPRDNLDRRSGR